MELISASDALMNMKPIQQIRNIQMRPAVPPLSRLFDMPAVPVHTLHSPKCGNLVKNVCSLGMMALAKGLR